MQSETQRNQSPQFELHLQWLATHILLETTKMKSSGYLSLLILLVALTIAPRWAAGQTQPQDSEAKPKVICFGDSITKRGYPELLQGLLDVEAVNAGVAGNSTTQALRRFSKDVLDKNPDVVVFFFGTNDLRVDAPKVHVPLAKYSANLQTMIESCKQSQAQPVLCTLPPINEDKFFQRHEHEPYRKAGGLKSLIRDYQKAAKKVAWKNDVPIVDLTQLLQREDNWLSKDGVHPSKSGTAIIANHVATAVSPLITQEKPADASRPRKFVHPGIAHTAESIELTKQKIKSDQQPWKDAWAKMKRSRYSRLRWRPDPRPHVKRGPSNDPDIGSSEFINDGNAAYTHSLLWVLTGEEAHAKKAAEIINAWSSTLETVSHHDAKLLIGMVGHHYCNAAELLKHRWDGWEEKDQAAFKKMLNEIWYPIIKDFYPSANGNWDASMLQTMIAMSIFLEDQAMFDKAVEYFRNGKGNGAISNYFNEFGECQESGRDQTHTQMGLEFLANTCESAWNQGVDLYGASDDRLLKGFEYTAKYNLGYDVRYLPYESFEGRYHYKSISNNSRGRLRPMYDKILNHYYTRKGIEAPFTLEAVTKNRPESRGGSSLPWATLMFGKPLPEKK